MHPSVSSLFSRSSAFLIFACTESSRRRLCSAQPSCGGDIDAEADSARDVRIRCVQRLAKMQSSAWPSLYICAPFRVISLSHCLALLVYTSLPRPCTLHLMHSTIRSHPLHCISDAICSCHRLPITLHVRPLALLTIIRRESASFCRYHVVINLCICRCCLGRSKRHSALFAVRSACACTLPCSPLKWSDGQS